MKSSKKENKIYLEKLSKQISREDIRSHFKNCGEIITINIIPKKLYNDAEIIFASKEGYLNSQLKNHSYLKNSEIKIRNNKNNISKKYYNEEELSEEDFNLNSSELLSENLNEENSINENIEYENFEREYKSYYKNNKKNLKEKLKRNTSDNININELLNEANSLYVNNKLDEAIEILKLIITKDANLIEPFQLLSLIYNEKGLIKEELDFLMLAAQLSSDKEMWIRCSKLNFKLKNYQQSEYCMTRASQLDKNNIYILYERGYLNEILGNLFKANKIYEKILSIYCNSDILIHTCQIYCKLQKLNDAINLIEKYYSKVHKKLPVLILLFDLYLKTKNYEKGIKTYNLILFNNNDFENIISNNNFQLKRLFCFIYILIKYDGDFSYLNELNIKESKDEIINKIISNFNKIIYDDYLMENVHLLFYIFYSLNKMNIFIEIFEQIEKNISSYEEDTFEKKKFNPEIYLKIAEYYFSNEQYEKSIEFFEKCLEIKNNDDNTNLILVKLSQAYEKINLKEKALEVLHRSFINNNLKENNEEIYSISENDEDKKMFQFYAENELNIKNEDYTLFDNNNIENENNLNEEDNNFLNKEMFSNEYFYPFPFVSKRLLGKKRIVLSSKNNNNKKKDKILIDYTFDNYLHNRIKRISHLNNKSRSNSISNFSFINQNITELKSDFNELFNEVKNNKNLYLELQQSLVYLNSNDKKNFLNKTYIPLKRVLMQELKIENFKNDLFNYILEKSQIKNYFYTKNSIFEQEENNINYNDNIDYDNNNINNNFNKFQESFKSIEDKNIDLDENKLEDNNNIIEKKDNLFVRKSSNKYYLSRKKVLPSIVLVEKEIKNIENVDKYINPDDFLKIIENFIIFSFEEKKYKETYSILILLFNSRNFSNRNDYFSYNMTLYGIMTCYHKKLYKTAFELLKRTFIKFNCQNFSFFWIQLWNIGKKINPQTLRSFMYKLYLNKSLSNNNFLKLIIGICYFQSNNYEFSLKFLNESIENFNNPFIYFIMSLSSLFQMMNRLEKNKKNKFIKSMRYLHLYSLKRKKNNIIEVYYNLGRFYQFLGHDNFAMKNYNFILYNIDNIFYLDKEIKEKIKRSCIYNISLIMKKIENEENAHNFICNNIVI